MPRRGARQPRLSARSSTIIERIIGELPGGADPDRPFGRRRVGPAPARPRPRRRRRRDRSGADARRARSGRTRSSRRCRCSSILGQLEEGGDDVARATSHTASPRLVPEDQADALYDQYIVPTPGKVYWDGIVNGAADQLGQSGPRAAAADRRRARPDRRREHDPGDLREAEAGAVADRAQDLRRPLALDLLDPGWEEVADFALDWARCAMPRASNVRPLEPPPRAA